MPIAIIPQLLKVGKDDCWLGMAEALASIDTGIDSK